LTTPHPCVILSQIKTAKEGKGKCAFQFLRAKKFLLLLAFAFVTFQIFIFTGNAFVARYFFAFYPEYLYKKSLQSVDKSV